MSMRWIVKALVVTLATGCTSVIHKRFTVEEDPPKSLSIDAKQRIAWVVKSKDGKNSDRLICVEPSPDAMVGVAAALALDVPVRIGGAALSAKAESSLAEAIVQLGTRTQTVQLLRDGLYRTCEAYINGIIDKNDYERLLRHYDMTMVMLVALDGLTQGCGTGASISTGATTSQSAKPAPPNAPAVPKPPAGGAPTPTPPTPTASPPTANGGTPAAAPGAPAVANPGSMTQDTTTTGTGVGSSRQPCALSDQAARSVVEVVKEFIQFKRPLHKQTCISRSLETLSKLKSSQEKTLANLSMAEIENAIKLAKAICDQVA